MNEISENLDSMKYERANNALVDIMERRPGCDIQFSPFCDGCDRFSLHLYYRRALEIMRISADQMHTVLVRLPGFNKHNNDSHQLVALFTLQLLHRAMKECNVENKELELIVEIVKKLRHLFWSFQCEEVWLWELFNELAKRNVMLDEIEYLKIHSNRTPAWEFKVAALMLKYATKTNAFYHDGDILRKPVFRNYLKSLVDEVPPKLLLEDSVSIVALSPRPFMRIAGMRFIICAFSHSLHSQSFLAIFPWESWQWPIGLLALFDDHTTLLYKMLTLLVEAEQSLEFQLPVSSADTYQSLIALLDYNADKLIKLQESNGHCYIFLVRFYKHQAQLRDPVMTEKQLNIFHQDLLQGLSRINTNSTALFESFAKLYSELAHSF